MWIPLLSINTIVEPKRKPVFSNKLEHGELANDCTTEENSLLQQPLTTSASERGGSEASWAPVPSVMKY